MARLVCDCDVLRYPHREDFAAAHAQGCSIKILGVAEVTSAGTLFASVSPRLVPLTDTVGTTVGATNVVKVNTCVFS